MSKKIISFILIIAILISGCGVSVFADQTSSVNSFWDYLMMSVIKAADLTSDLVDGIPLIGGKLSYGANLVGVAAAAFSQATCPVSDDHLHHGHVILPATVGEDEYGTCVLCSCDYCSNNFWAYGSDLEALYQDTADELPAQTINSDGTFIYTAEHDYCSIRFREGRAYCPDYPGGPIEFPETISIQWYPSVPGFYVTPAGDATMTSHDVIQSYWKLVAPVSGVYKRLSSSGGYVLSDGQYKTLFNDWSPDNGVFHAAGSVTSITQSLGYNPQVWWYGSSTLNVVFDAPRYLVTPSEALNIFTGDTYNIDNRVSNYVTQYLVDNSVNTTQIINETNNTYYSPITNETYDMSGWTYDYSTRTYNITIDGSDGATVTFGDNAIQIVEGNVTNNYYYYITPSDDPDDPGGDTSGLLAWLQEVWPNLMAKLDEIKDSIGGDGSGSGSDHWWQDSDNPDDPDDPDADDDLGILELFKTVLRGLINILNGFLSLIFDGIENLIEWIGSIGDFFDYFSPNSDLNIWTVEEGST